VALCVHGRIFASLSPAGFAIKLPEHTRKTLIDAGKATEFRFFARGPIKREYVALSESALADHESVRELIASSVSYALSEPSPKSAADKQD